MAEIVQIASEANRRGMIENREWRGAIILGPAVLAPLENVHITHSTFDAADPETIFIEIPEGRAVVGFIGLRDVRFDDCEFRNVGIAGTPESIAAIKRGFPS